MPKAVYGAMSAVDEECVVVFRTRIRRLVDLFRLGSLEELDQAALALEPLVQDTFGELEVATAEFLNELRRAEEHNARTLQVVEAAREQVEEKLATIEQQRATIRELSTPILDLWEGVLALPIVGAVDAERAADMTDRLLQRVVDAEAREVILDLTGLAVVDTQAADLLGRLVRATALLGARCTITGLSPELAQTMVSIGLDMSGIRMHRTMRDALRDSLNATSRARSRP